VWCLYTPEIEVFLYLPYDGKKMDVPSLGTVLYGMVTGDFLFKGKTSLQVQRAVLELGNNIPSHLSMGVRNVVQMLMKILVRGPL
jgi:serine/threonine protein kinase